MTRKFLCFSLCILLVAAVISVAAKPTAPVVRLPEPHYHQEESDPDWMRMAVQFHGHLGPAIVVGFRVGAEGLDAVQAQGYFDVEITAEGPFAAPPKSCLLDGLQLSTGATLGKRNLHVIESDEYLIRINNKRNGKAAEIRLTPELLKLMWSRLEADDHEKDDAHAETHRAEAIARQIAEFPTDKIMTITILP